MLVATLIGFFITAEGILIGADTAVTNNEGFRLIRPKYCQTGPHTVATLQGQYYFDHPPSKSTAALYNLFRDVCGAIERSGKPQGVAEQADAIIEVLRAEMAKYLARVPARDVELHPDSIVVARVTVAGYDGSQPVVTARGLSIIGTAETRWEARSVVLPRLSFAACGSRFQGEEAVVEALRSGDVRISPGDLRTPEVAALRRPDGDCAKRDLAAARAMFVAATRLTIALGSQFNIRGGAVGPPVDLVVIPANGIVKAERLEKW